MTHLHSLLKDLYLISWFLEFYVLTTYMVIPGRLLTCDSAHSMRLNDPSPMGNQVTGTMTRYHTQTHYPGTELTSPCPLLITMRTRLGSDKYQIYKSLVWLEWEPNSWSPTHGTHALLTRSPGNCGIHILSRLLVSCMWDGRSRDQFSIKPSQSLTKFVYLLGIRHCYNIDKSG